MSGASKNLLPRKKKYILGAYARDPFYVIAGQVQFLKEKPCSSNRWSSFKCDGNKNNLTYNQKGSKFGRNKRQERLEELERKRDSSHCETRDDQSGSKRGSGKQFAAHPTSQRFRLNSNFQKETEVEKWIAEQIIVATSENYGEDYEEVLKLLRMHETFMEVLEARDAYVSAFWNSKMDTSSQFTANKIQQLWLELFKKSEKRLEGLQLRAYFYKADKIICEIKDATPTKHQALKSNVAMDTIKGRIKSVRQDGRVLGGHCPHFQEDIKSKDVEIIKCWAKLKGNTLSSSSEHGKTD